MPPRNSSLESAAEVKMNFGTLSVGVFERYHGERIREEKQEGEKNRKRGSGAGT